MSFKLFAGLLGLAMMIGFLLPPILKIVEPSMIAVVLIGIAMAVYEYYETLRDREG